MGIEPSSLHLYCSKSEGEIFLDLKRKDLHFFAPARFQLAAALRPLKEHSSAKESHVHSASTWKRSVLSALEKLTELADTDQSEHANTGFYAWLHQTYRPEDIPSFLARSPPGSSRKTSPTPHIPPHYLPHPHYLHHPWLKLCQHLDQDLAHT